MKQIQTIFSLGNYAKSLKVDKYTCNGACLAFLFLFLFLSVHAGIKMTATLCHGEAGIYVCNFHGNVYSFLMCYNLNNVHYFCNNSKWLKNQVWSLKMSYIWHYTDLEIFLTLN